MTFDADLESLEFPAENGATSAARVSQDALALLARRRSSKPFLLAEPAPAGDELDTLLRLAARVPDHGKLGPWRFAIIEGAARERLGGALAEIRATDPDADEIAVAKERTRFTEAPLCVMVVSTAALHAKIPEWEQILSAGAVCFNLLIAAHAAGYGGVWLTGWAAYDDRAKAALGVALHERIAGFIYLGTPTQDVPERVRADVSARIHRL